MNDNNSKSILLTLTGIIGDIRSYETGNLIQLVSIRDNIEKLVQELKQHESLAPASLFFEIFLKLLLLAYISNNRPDPNHSSSAIG